MPYIGDDIISLLDEKNRSSFSQERYLSKAFTPSERDLIETYKDSLTCLPFLIWSCKESAYKVMVKDGLRDAFCPIDFQINTQKLGNDFVLQDLEIRQLTGEGNYKGTTMHFQSFINDEYIHSIASISKLSQMTYYRGVQKIPNMSKEQQSLSARELFASSLANTLKTNPEEIQITKNEHEVPSVYVPGPECNIDLSLSHDDAYLSYAYILN